MNWPADHVERWAIDRLIPYARNSRSHSDAQVAQIAESMREWGWTNPVLVDESGSIIAGHGRVLAARQLGYPEVPVMVAHGWSEAQRKAYLIADNKLALNAGWDSELLAQELTELQISGFDLDVIGFDDKELEKLLRLKPEIKEKTVTLRPITKTRILISVNTQELHKISGAIDSIVKLGVAEIDYSGN